MKKIYHRYSGKKSHKFWNVIAKLTNGCDRQELYSLGVALQNLEQYVLKCLNDAINKEQEEK